jgi:K+-sensing histidine kinase KdpD
MFPIVPCSSLSTPLAVITAASSALNDESMVFEAAARRSLTAQIEVKADEMSGIISNVLELIRLETGRVVLRRQWIMLQELLNPSLARLEALREDGFLRIDVENEGPGLPAGVRTGGAHRSRCGPPAFAGGTHAAMSAADHERERSRG